MKSRAHSFFDPLSHTYRGLQTTLNPMELRWDLSYLPFVVELLAETITTETVDYSLIQVSLLTWLSWLG